MRKISLWIFIVSLVSFLITWGVIGIKLLDGNYEFMTEAYIALVFFIITLVGLLVYKFSGCRCPHCGKVRLDTGKYCSHCGKELP